MPEILRPSSSARTTPQKSTEAPAAPFHLLWNDCSGLVVIRIFECQVAICFSEPGHSVATAGGRVQEIPKMKTNQCDIGLIGLAVMGENLVFNMESKGF